MKQRLFSSYQILNNPYRFLKKRNIFWQLKNRICQFRKLFLQKRGAAFAVDLHVIDLSPP